ncbi:MAG: aminoacyl-tRNA hydrolase [Rhodospirillaceae bacterium]|jgi:peptidyl-tRNA hydrolase, PTH1 family|nr:aminoacyl-tRNA hydrolase [Rhodospirillaceae bacterium]MBT5243549.1 aminoacyl-tRNA hydrolase [Rhodospirillaceae bacterium]MBT5562137.1 aminoacyl-tRNA hydrolase [Rhodospirillaceae bacterium]MBT6242310.1 aminoacyl-tRNA hydrolase [Rhodospirillaceae bacterium]MBT7137678.1 aminoacyl-tRNA hydrolase [Rhodospirillaceae bacterium]
MLLLVGLGNPGGDYARNRHNIGFMAVDEIVRRHSFQPFRAKFNGALAEGRIGNAKVLALKPATYMNESGRSVAAAANFYKIDPADVLVIHDELDLEAGKLKLKSGGGHAGHNGLRSIHAHLGEGYRRLRLGIGHPGDKSQVTNHVLKDFAKADQQWLEPLLVSIADHIDMALQGDDAGFLNKVALNTNPPKNKNKDEG